MELEASASASAVAKKLSSIIKVLMLMLRKGVSKSKIMMELHLLLKRGKLAGKAIADNFILHYNNHVVNPASSLAGSAFSCRSNAAVSFISPRDYEFSCSNSPAAPFHRRHHHHHRRGEHYDDVSAAVQKVLEMYYNNNNGGGAGGNCNNWPPESPAVMLPGFGKSPMVPVRQLRITDSPFPIKDDGLGDKDVDLKAENFINKFRRGLRQQKSMAYLESPYRDHYG